VTRDTGVYIISVAAELAGVHPQTLRTYERKGLLTPKRTSGGTRRYSERDVARVQLIQQLTQAEGVNLAGVLRILELEDEVDRLQRRLEQAQRALEEARAESQAALREAQRRAGTELVLYRRTQIERHRSRR
jgi:MerR family transcriptional regulator/heat shock protein HspR